MSRLLLIGFGPLLTKGVRNFGGQCLRTWCFAEPLLRDGHDLRLVTVPIYDPNDPAMHHAALEKRETGGLEYQAFSNLDFEFIHAKLTDLAREIQPDAIFAINSTPAWIAARLPVRIPLWVDLFGYEMAEKQGRAAMTGDTGALLDAWRKEALLARRADKFSTVSHPQLHALLGELASLGRLNRFTFHYPFAHLVPIAYHPAFAEMTPAWERRADEKTLRGPVTPDDAFILLWSGGYNYWTDPEDLFGFLESVMAAEPRVHFVSTGGAIAGYNTQTYEEFSRRVEGSPFRERYHLLGWVPAEQLPGIYAEADLGLNLDDANMETLFGARNRINNMMAAGLPVLSTEGTEISHIIAEAGCGIVVPPADRQALARAVLDLARSPARRLDLARESRRFAFEAFDPAHLTRPAREWAQAPALAPDNAEKARQHPDVPDLRALSINYVEALAAAAEEENVPTLRRDQERLENLRARPWYRALRAARRGARQLTGKSSSQSVHPTEESEGEFPCRNKSR
ncbi:glycosyltransferase [bacterium]|nr:glycosyltransferase [bacterium]